MIVDDVKKILDSEQYENYHGAKSHYLEHYELDNIEILDKIYNKASSEERRSIIEVLISYPIYEYYLPFDFLIRKGLIEEAFFGINSDKLVIMEVGNQFSKSDYYLEECLIRLHYLLKMKKFSHSQLELIKDVMYKYLRDFTRKEPILISSVNPLKEEIIREITLKHTELVKERYSGELLSEDIDKTTNLIKELGFDDKISNLIQTLKNSYYECDNDIKSNIYATKVRDVLMEIIKNICSEISNGEKIENKDEHYRKYLLKKRLIKDYEERFISHFYGFLSDLNNHGISTPKEYFRLSINMVSEISLILLYNYKKYKAKSS